MRLLSRSRGSRTLRAVFPATLREAEIDRRVQRTRHALVEAFSRLVLERRQNIRVADVVAAADVGRSTFYDHYSGTEALHLEALKRPLGPLADAVAGRGDVTRLTNVLQHVWEYRQRARNSLDHRADRLLADMVEERLSGEEFRLPRRLVARLLAGAALGSVAGWLRGEAPCTPAQLAASILTTSAAMREALTSSVSLDPAG